MTCNNRYFHEKKQKGPLLGIFRCYEGAFGTLFLGVTLQNENGALGLQGCWRACYIYVDYWVREGACRLSYALE